MARLSAGDLTERVVFQRRPDVDGELGDWANLYDGLEFPAKIRPTRRTDAVIAARLGGVNVYDIWLWSSSETRTVTADDRAIWKHESGDIPMNIRGEPIDPDGRRMEVHIMAERGVAI